MNRPMSRISPLYLAVMSALMAAPVGADTCIWNPANGNWNVAANWSCGFVPTNLDLAVIDSGKTVTVTGAQPTTSVSNDGMVTISNNSSIGLTDTNTNNGVIGLNSIGNATDLTINGAVSLNGTGTVQMSNSTANRILGTAATLTLGSGQSISGSGQVGAGGSLALINNGIVSATQGSPLTIHTTAGVTNNNVLRADGGTLVVQNTAVNQGAPGSLDAINGSTVQLSNASITGGSFTSSGGGAIATVAGTTNALSGVTNAATFNVVNNSVVNLDGNLVNNGTVNLQSIGNATNLTVTGARTISGTGTINLSNTQANRINGTGGTLTLGSGQTLQGAGTIGAGSAGFALVNQGTVIAASNAGLLINAAAGVTNTGTLRADGGALQLQTTVNSAGGNIEALNGSQVQLLNGAVINNANFSASGAGSLITTVSGATVTLGGGTVSGPMTIANNSFVRQTGDLTYNGVLSMASIGNPTELQIDGVRSITGAATLNMTNIQANRIVAANGPGDQFTLGNTVTLQGAGQLGAGTALALVNNGTVIATQSGGLRVETSAGVTNNGVMRADGGPLQFRNVVVNSAGGSIEAVNGSQVQLENGTVINNANFSASGAGSLITTVSGANVTLGGGTVSGPMTIANNSFVRQTGDLTYNGVLSMASIGNPTELQIDGVRSLTGAATINMTNIQANRIVAANGPGDQFTLGNTVTLQGAGQLGAGTALAVINNGSLIANSSAGMVLSTPAGATNNALIRGDGATFTIANTQVNQGASGVLNAINNGAIVLNTGTQINGGTFSTASGGEVAVRSGNTASIAGVTNTGALNINNNASLNLNGTLTNNGSVNLQSIGNPTELRADGNQSILGTGTINMTNTTANRILGVAAGDGLTLGAGQTLQGAGQIGAGTNFNFTNNGTITANQSNPLTIAMSGLVSNAAGGLMQATTGGTLNVNSALANAGTLAANGGVVNANAAFNGTGTASISGAGRLNLGANSTAGALTHNGSAANGLALGANNITVSGDYTNANSGTGNAFNRRANVTGTGQILAGGDATQAITGAGVSNGNTANATLTIGNVHVGANNFAYQVANTGTTGPSLRGAIQTNVNGANLTDARLSGAGVTASNYNTGAPGSNTGNLGVTFTAASAGALAPLSGQVLNLSSNFDNIADQKLNIVLGAGAAAYNLAIGNATPSPVTIANQREGGTGSQVLTVSNTAPGGGFTEGLNASFGVNTGNATNNAGGINLLAGGASNGSNMAVGVNTGSAGAKSGTVTLNYVSDGSGTSGLGLTGVGNQVINISGNVYRVAQGDTTPLAVNFGNRRVNDAASQALTIQNTAANDGFSESLNASFGGPSGHATTNAGNVSLLAAGGVNNSNMVVGLDTSTAGAKNGSVDVNYQSDGTGSSGLAAIAAGGQTVNVTGNVYQVAQGQLSTAPLNFGTVQVGQAVSQTLSISNIATGAAGFVEDLNASFGASSGPGAGQISGVGAINGLLAGATNASNMVVNVNTATAGAINGAIAVNYFSAGEVNGVSNGLGVLAVGSDSYGVSGLIEATGQVINAANPVINTAQPIQLGNVRIGAASPTALVSVTNQTTTAPQAALNASISGNAPITASGSFNLLDPGQTNSTALQVGMNTGTAGAINGTATIAFVSDASNVGGCEPNCQMNLASQNVTVEGAVYRLANPLLNTSDVTLAARRGDAAPNAALSVSNQSPDVYTEGLKATIASTPAGFSGSGDIANLAAGGTDASSLQVALNTATAGNFGGNAQVDFQSTGAGTTGEADVSVGSGLVNLVGKVYEAAVAKVNTVLVDFGIVHKGDVVAAQNVSVSNDAPLAGLNDTLMAQFVNLPNGPFSGSGGVSGLAAGQTDASSLMLGLDTSNAGVFNTSGNHLQFASHNPDMADLDLGEQVLAMTAQINNYANPDFQKTGGAGNLSGGGLAFMFDFGILSEGGAPVSATLQLANDVTGPADLLDGLFDLSGLGVFSTSGFVNFADLGAGDFLGGLQIGLNILNTGVYNETIVLKALGHNASGYSAAFDDILLTVRADVRDTGQVPEPATLLLLTIALAGMLLARRRGRVMH